MKFQNKKSNLSLRRSLIQMNIQLDSIKSWTTQNDQGDHFATISSRSLLYSQMPNVVRDILLLEDRSFFKHMGFELRSLPRGLKRLYKYGRFGGVSTIDQLLVRTYLQRRERTANRKIREIILAYLINLHHSKAEILMAFVNCAYFGPKLNGADTAAKVIFGKRASTLSEDESALISCLLPYPLPPNVSIFLRSHGPCDHYSELLSQFSEENPWWTKRIRSRIEHLENLRLRHLKDAL